MVAYKSKNLYDDWTKGGPEDSLYNYSASGWFDILLKLLEQCFLKLLLPHITANWEGNETIVLGDNLTSHFSTKSCEGIH